MRRALASAGVVLGLLACSASAELIQCPATHQGARLIGAGMFAGENKQYELKGAAKEVRNGFDVDYGFNAGDVKWVACWYKPATARWYEVSRAAQRCSLEERRAKKGKRRAKVTCS